MLLAELEQKLICVMILALTNSRALITHLIANIRPLLSLSPSTSTSQNYNDHVCILCCFPQFPNYFHLCYLLFFSEQPQELDKFENIISNLDVSKVRFRKVQRLAHVTKVHGCYSWDSQEDFSDSQVLSTTLKCPME